MNVFVVESSATFLKMQSLLLLTSCYAITVSVPQIFQHPLVYNFSVNYKQYRKCENSDSNNCYIFVFLNCLLVLAIKLGSTVLSSLTGLTFLNVFVNKD
jgi:hypothetical protein